MGAEFAIYKRSPKEVYQLGKPRLGYAPGTETPTVWDQVKNLSGIIATMVTAGHPGNPSDPKEQRFQELFAERSRLTDPSWHALWSIMDPEGNTKVFRLNGWDREVLADHLYRGLPVERNEALVIADDLLRWAGGGDLVLYTDSGDSVSNEMAEVGFPRRGYKETGSIWEAVR